MCGRYTSTVDPAVLATELDALDEVENWDGPRYNAAPTDEVLVVARRRDRGAPPDAETRLRIRSMRWGLVPAWKKEVSGKPLFNARAETAATTASFKTSLPGRRCLLPMDGWYEWRVESGPDGRPRKQACYMTPRDGSRLFMAGLWTAWRTPAPEASGSPWLLSTTILTTAAVGPLAQVHDRMPLVMPREWWDDWLDPDAPPDPALLAPPALELVRAIEIREVSSLVNSVRNDGPELIDPAEPEPEQGTLL